MTASGTYHENDNRCWGASSGAIALALDAGANRIDFLVVDDEGEEFSDYMTRNPAAASPDCRPKNKITRSAGAAAVKKDTTAKSGSPGGTGNAGPATRFVPYRIFDPERNMVAAVIRTPADWRAQGNVIWNYQDASFPVRVEARAESQTADVWVEGFPTEMFFWLEPDYQPMSNGVRKLGMIRQTPLSAEDALLHYIVIPARGNRRDFRVINSRRISDLSRTFSDKPVSGQSVAIRFAYQHNGRPVQEEFYGLLTDIQSVPYHGPQGTTVEHHIWLQYVHSMGAAHDNLDSMKSLLGGIAGSYSVNPSWLKAVEQVTQYLAQEFNAQLARDYAGIQAAGQLSRQISAQNDAWLENFEQQRIASDRQMDRFMADLQSGSEAVDKTNENFSDYMRGTEKMQDPYWGESDQPYDYQYHWTDGQGGYKHSNDLGDNPNIGSTRNWSLMQPAQ